MNDKDYEAFQREFARLSAALASFKISPADLQSKTDAYFHVLKSLPFDVVVAKADSWLAHETKFPKPVEWKNQIIISEAVPLEKMSDAESLEHHQAEISGYEREACGCQSCVEAGVNEKPQRYVPLEKPGSDWQVVTKLNRFDKAVTAGRWIHGWELFRWYEARAGFWNHCYEIGLMDTPATKRAERIPFIERIEALFKRKQMPS